MKHGLMTVAKMGTSPHDRQPAPRQWADPHRVVALGEAETTQEAAVPHESVVNLTTGLEDAEKVTVAFLVAVAGRRAGRHVDVPDQGGGPPRRSRRRGGVACEGCPPLPGCSSLHRRRWPVLVCPICFNARQLDQGELVANATLAGATPMLDWMGDDDTQSSATTSRAELFGPAFAHALARALLRPGDGGPRPDIEFGALTPRRAVEAQTAEETLAHPAHVV